MFRGFSALTTDFLWNIRFNNERSWFSGHKQEYLDHLWEPFHSLATETYDLFTAAHPELLLNLHVSRIYRDARRLYGRGPYKDHLWFSIRPEDERWYERPMYWFEITPEGYGFGLGIYAHNPKQMEHFRREADSGSSELLRLAREFEKQQLFEIEGDDYARKKGDAPAPLDKWYNKKSISLTCHRLHDANYYSEALVQELAEAYTSLLPYYRYFDSLACRLMAENEPKAAPKDDKFDF